MRDGRDGGAVNDDVDVTIASGKCGEIVFTRQATLASSTTAEIRDVTTYFRLILQYVVEFGDVDDSGDLSDGDDIRYKLDVDTLTCDIKRSSSSFSGATCYTITVYSDDGILTFTYTICSAAITIGTRDIPSRSAFEILEVHWPFHARDSKLAFWFDAYTRNVGDIFTWDAASATLLLNNNRGSLKMDLQARSGDNDIIPLHFRLVGLPLSNARARPDENKAYRLIVSADAYAPTPLIIDPVFNAGNQPATVTTADSSATHVHVGVLLIVVSFILALVL
jgi:hypothetical protein